MTVTLGSVAAKWDLRKASKLQMIVVVFFGKGDQIKKYETSPESTLLASIWGKGTIVLFSCDEMR